MYLVTQTDNFEFFYEGFGSPSLSPVGFEHANLLNLGRFNPNFDGSGFLDEFSIEVPGPNYAPSANYADGPLSNAIPGNTSTAATLAVGAQVVSTIDFSGDNDWFKVTLVAGTTYDISQLGNGSGLSDPLVRIMNAAGVEQANNDDIILSDFRDSLLVFTATTSGTYYISAEAFSTQTGSYTLSLNEANSGEVAASTATTASAILNGSISGTIETAGDSDWYAITLTAGSRYIISNTGSGSTILSDSFLELRDAAGTVIESDDNDGPSDNARLAYNIATTGTYYVSASAVGNAIGDYAVTVEEVPFLVERDLDSVANFLTDEFSSRSSYNAGGGGATVINFSFASGANSLSAGAEALARRALDAWASVANITFVEGPGDIVFRNDGDGAFNSNTRTGSLVTSSDLNVESTWNGGNVNLDSYTYQTFLHEIGHALGLGHAGPYNGNATYNLDNAYLNDSWAYTVMSYFDQNESGYFGDLRFVLGPQIADIIAIQDLYGANTTTRSGNTTYGFNSTETDVHDFSQFLRAPSLSIYDKGGIDTLDFSGYSAIQNINLNEEAFSDVDGTSGVISIARGTVIENAIGGSGRDTITGNASNNVLTGGGGNDILDGGAGTDYAVYSGSSINEYTITNNANGTVTVAHNNGGADGTDTLSNIEFIKINGVDHALGGAPSDIDLTENVDVYTGTSGADVINALGGDDTVFGAGGNDTINGGAGNDNLYGDAGADTLNGGADNDWFYADTSDTIAGGSGYDTISFVDLYASGVTYHDLGAMGIERVYATHLADTLNASTSTVRVDLQGYEGADTLIGGSGNDYIYFDVEDINGGDVQGGAGYDYMLNYTPSNLNGDVTVDLGARGFEGYFGSSANEVINAATATQFATIYSAGGTDTITGSAFNDYIFVIDTQSTVTGGAGFDYIVYNVFDGSGLSWTLTDANSMDGAIGRGGDDTFDASGHTDFVTLYGAGGADILIGGGGIDAIYGGTGNDTMTGNGSQDNFVFYAGWGTDIITDFTDGVDKLLMSVNGLTSFAQFTVTQDGADTLVSYSGQSIRLQNFTATDLDASDFDIDLTAAEAPPVDKLAAEVFVSETFVTADDGLEDTSFVSDKSTVMDDLLLFEQDAPADSLAKAIAALDTQTYINEEGALQVVQNHNYYDSILFDYLDVL